VRVDNSFIGVSGVGEKTERGLWEAGVTHWDDFHPEPVGPKTGERIEAFIDEGRSHLDDENVAFFDERFPLRRALASLRDVRRPGVFLRHRDHRPEPQWCDVTTVSLHQDGETMTLVRGDDLTAESLRAAFADAGLLVSFNGKRFDVPFLETCYDVDLDIPTST